MITSNNIIGKILGKKVNRPIVRDKRAKNQKIDEDTYNRIIYKLEMEGKPITEKNIQKAHKDFLEAKKYNKTPLDR